MNVTGTIAEGTASQYVRAIGDYFIDVHIRLSARARLPDHKGELIVELTREDLITHSNDALGLVEGEHAEFAIGESRSLLQYRETVDDFERHAAGWIYTRVTAGALRLRASVFVGGYLYFAYRVGFDAVFHVYLPVKRTRWFGAI